MGGALYIVIIRNPTCPLPNHTDSNWWLTQNLTPAVPNYDWW